MTPMPTPTGLTAPCGRIEDPAPPRPARCAHSVRVPCIFFLPFEWGLYTLVPHALEFIQAGRIWVT